MVYSWPSGTMKICEDPATKLNQCSAEAHCNKAGGWHLCNATEYLQRGGAVSGTSNLAWLKACIRAGGNLTAPTDGLCDTTCPSMSATGVDVGWDCAEGKPVFTLNSKMIGVVSSAMCLTLGVQTSAQGRWSPLVVTVPSSAAVCCSP